MADGVFIKWTIQANRFPAIIAGLESKTRAIVAKTAIDLQSHARTRVPVDTGTLKNSIQAAEVRTSAAGRVHWRVTVGADYGMYVEWGTVRMAAQPFIQPAIAAVSPSFYAAMKKVAS